jgi:hypothetical protein
LGSILLCGFLVGMLVVMLTLAATIGVAYFGIMEMYGLLLNHPENSPVSRYLSSIILRKEFSVWPERNQDDNNHED